MYALVGYEDTRYHVESAVLVTFLFLLLCEVTREKRSWKNLRYLMPVFILGVSLFQIRGTVKNIYLDPVSYPLVNVDAAPDWVMSLDAEMESRMAEWLIRTSMRKFCILEMDLMNLFSVTGQIGKFT